MLKDKGAVQHIDTAGNRLDKGAVEASDDGEVHSGSIELLSNFTIDSKSIMFISSRANIFNNTFLILPNIIRLKRGVIRFTLHI